MIADERVFDSWDRANSVDVDRALANRAALDRALNLAAIETQLVGKWNGVVVQTKVTSVGNTYRRVGCGRVTRLFGKPLIHNGRSPR